MNINVWSNFSKKVNSTAQPTSGTQKTVLLKEETDVESPSFILGTTDLTINYVEAFGRYYFAKCKSLDGNRTEIICTPDRLATFKSQIGSYTGFIEYSGGSIAVTIPDPRNQPTCDVVMKQSNETLLSDSILSGTGSYVIGVISDDVNGASGSVQYYGMTASQMADLMQEVFNTNGFWTSLKNQFNDTMNSLVSCIWLPFANLAISNVFGSPQYIKIGENQCSTAQGRPLLYRIFGPNAPIVLTVDFPYSSKGHTYLDKAPYSSGTLFLPFVGNVPLDIDAIFTTRKITIDFSIDVITGDIVYRIMYSDDNADYRFATYSGNLATKVPVSGASYDAIGEATGIITSAGGVLAAAGAIAGGVGGKALAAGITTALAGGYHAATSIQLHAMVNGSASSALGVSNGGKAIATIITNVPAELNLTAFQAEQGMPFFRTAQVSTQSGFIKMANASVSIPGSQEDKDAVNGFLNSGFFYE